jgi:ATP phosphoribosyltransferase
MTPAPRVPRPRPSPAPAAPPQRPLRLAVPNKGRLSEEAIDLLRRAGIVLQGSSERKLFASALGGRLQVLFLRAQDIPEFVADGTVDAGMTGLDVVKESQVDVRRRLDLGFGACRLVLAVPEGSPVRSPKDVKAGTRIATSFPNLAKAHFAKIHRKVRIVPVSGACEVTPMLGVADAIVDLTSSGSTLAMNHLREAGTLLESSCHLIAARSVDRAVREELDRLQFALESVLAAAGKRYLLADLPRKSLKEVQSFLPGVAGPTVVDIAGKPDLVAIQVVVDEAEIYDAVHRLRKLGGTGILVVPIDRMVA